MKGATQRRIGTHRFVARNVWPPATATSCPDSQSGFGPRCSVLAWLQSDLEHYEKRVLRREVHDPVPGRFEARLISFGHLSQSGYSKLGFSKISADEPPWQEEVACPEVT